MTLSLWLSPFRPHIEGRAVTTTRYSLRHWLGGLLTQLIHVLTNEWVTALFQNRTYDCVDQVVCNCLVGCIFLYALPVSVAGQILACSCCAVDMTLSNVFIGFWRSIRGGRGGQWRKMKKTIIGLSNSQARSFRFKLFSFESIAYITKERACKKGKWALFCHPQEAIFNPAQKHE